MGTGSGWRIPQFCEEHHQNMCILSKLVTYLVVTYLMVTKWSAWLWFHTRTKPVVYCCEKPLSTVFHTHKILGCWFWINASQNLTLKHKRNTTALEELAGPGKVCHKGYRYQYISIDKWLCIYIYLPYFSSI